MLCKKFLLALPFLLFALFTSCAESEEVENYVLRGSLITSEGDPYSDMDLHIRNYLAPSGFVEPPGTEYNTSISFTVEEDSPGTVIVFKYGRNEILSTILDEELQAGEHTVAFPSELMSNGVYGYTIQVGDANSTGYFVVNRSDSSLFEVLPFTYTDSNGEFSFPIRELGIGEIFYGTESEIFIEDSLMIIGIKDGEILGKAKLQVDTNRDNEVELILE